MVIIHRDAKFNKCLDGLRRGGGEAIQAAHRAEEIIEELASRGTSSIGAMQKRTKHGELRIDKCIKFDLGCAYRLICIRQKYHWFLLYVGTHDDCDRWLNNNRGLQLEQYQNMPDAPEYPAIQPDTPVSVNPPDRDVDYDEIALKEIRPRDLRWVFRGLCGDSQKQD